MSDLRVGDVVDLDGLKAFGEAPGTIQSIDLDNATAEVRWHFCNNTQTRALCAFSNDLALNIRPEVRALCSRLWYKTQDQHWNRWSDDSLKHFEYEFLSLGLPTKLEAQLLGLHRWALDQQHNAVLTGSIVAVLANVGFECFQTGDGREHEPSPNGKPRIYYQPLTGSICASSLWLDRRWGPAYEVQYNEAIRLPDDWHF